jgi:hypothetical protein
MAAEAWYQLSSCHVEVAVRGVFGSRLAGMQEAASTQEAVEHIGAEEIVAMEAMSKARE